MTDIPVKAHTRSKPEKSEAYKRTHQILREWADLQRSRSVAQAKPETAPVPSPVARNPIAAMVISLMRQAVGIDRQVRERTDA